MLRFFCNGGVGAGDAPGPGHRNARALADGGVGQAELRAWRAPPRTAAVRGAGDERCSGLYLRDGRECLGGAPADMYFHATRYWVLRRVSRSSRTWQLETALLAREGSDF